MEHPSQLDSSLSSAALEPKTLGINPSRYYRPEPRLGFTPFAELWNGRLAMVGIVVALVFEMISHHAL
ncbi:MAG: chlorophyll a/b-binding protein [Phormidesmis sp.]